MGETTRPEALEHRRRLVAVVADDEPAEQRRVIGRKRRRPSFDRGADAVRRDRERRSRGDVAHPVDAELADDVLPRDSTGASR